MGTLLILKRDKAKSLIQSASGKVAESLSQKTNYLVVGIDAGSKLEEGEFSGIANFPKKELLNLINL